MGSLEYAEQSWAKLSSDEREAFLGRLAKATPGYNSGYWGGISFEDLATANFDDLPSDLRGRLMMAVTEKGFSIKESRQVEKKLLKK